LPKDGGSRRSLPDDLKLACHTRSNGFNDVYGRMRWNDVAPTITSGCTNPSKGRFVHPEFDRAITLREGAMLQGFPQHYRFDPTHGKGAIALMIGNALPPPFIAAHAKTIRRHIHSYGRK
jgi:DNA (cytosine-5)-methyltransferase 1